MASVSGAGLTAGGKTILVGIDWELRQGERWVVIGPNGSGKTSLLRLLGGALRPSTGAARLPGQVAGASDLRELRKHVGIASSAVTRSLRQSLAAADAVMTAKHGALEPWWHEYRPEDREAAIALLEVVGLSELHARRLEDMSEGERQQVMLARAFYGSPAMVLLDEPAAGLDLGAREVLLQRLARLAGRPGAGAGRPTAG
ncbi:MAG: ATP-binding cassette domain-containing protein, partial [Acidimicrobiales bacterium]